MATLRIGEGEAVVFRPAQPAAWAMTLATASGRDT